MKVFIGYDPRQPVAYNVLAHSVWTRASKPVEITRLQLNCLPIKRRGLTEFTYSRFLVPYLSEFKDYSIFLDSDMLCLGDVHELGALAMAEFIKYGVEHPADITKSEEGKKIITEHKMSVCLVKNARAFEWPSMMVFNNEACKVLTPEFVDNTQNSLYDLKWANSVGELPARWNQIVGYDAPNSGAQLIHYTQGIPCWPETVNCEFSAEWKRELKSMVSTVSFNDLMGNSVHAAPVKERLAAEAIK